MRIYLASRYNRKFEMKEHAKEAESNGIQVGADWINETEHPESTLGESTPETLAKYAQKDYWDVAACDVFVFFAEDPLIGTPRGGRHVEFGIALALDKTIVIVGEPENIFHHSPYADIDFFPTWDSALFHLRMLNGEE